MPSVKPSAGDFAIGPPRAAELNTVLAEDFSVLILRPPRLRWVGDEIVLLH